jgi:hypothetical protein
MPQFLPLPDGSSLKLREGESPQAGWARAFESYPEAFGFEKPQAPVEDKQGFMAGIRSGIENLKGDVGALGAGLGIEGGEAYARAQAAKAAELYQQPKFTEAPVDYVTGMLGQSLPYIAAPLAAGAAAATAPVSGALGLGATAASLGAAGLASATQFTGSNLARQLAEGRTTDTLETGNAALASIPQAALDVLSLKLLPGIGRIFGAAGKELTEDAAKAAARAALARGTGNLVKQYGGAAVKTAGIEGLTETGQQVLERAQAELEMLDIEARGEYLDSFIGGALLGGTLAVPGKAFERGSDRSKMEREDRALATQKEALAAQEKTKLEDSDEYALDFEKQFFEAREKLQALENQKRVIKKDSPTADIDREFNRQLSTRVREFRDEIGFKGLLEQYVALRPRIEKAKRMTEMTPEDALAESIGIPSTLTRDPRTGEPRRRAVMSGAALPEGIDAEAFPAAPLTPEEQVPYYVQQQLSAATQRAKQEAIDNNPELTMAGIDASQGVRLSGEQMIEALAENPGRAMAVVQTRGALPGMSAEQANLVRAGLRSRLKQIGSEMGAGREQADARRAEIEREIQALRDMRSRTDGADVARMRQMTIRERELQAELDEINKLAAMNTAQTAQGTLFPQETLRSDIISGSGVTDGTPTRAKLESDLQLARIFSDKKAAERIIEELRELKQREAKESTSVSALGDTRPLQEAFGSKQPQNVKRSQAASDARSRAYANMVTILDRFNKGKAKQEDLNAAEQQVYSSLVAEVEALRGAEIEAAEREQLLREARAQVGELQSRMGDTRDAVDIGDKDGQILVPEDSRAAGAGRGTAMGVTRLESQPAGRRTFANRYAAAQSIQEGLDEIRNKFVAPTQGSGVERTITPERITDAMLDKLVQRVAPNRLSDADAALFERIQDDLPGIKTASVDGESATEIVGEYLYGLTTDTASPAMRKDVQDILRDIDEAKRSETEQVTERAGRAYTPEEREALRGTSREGKEGGMGRRATGEVRRAVQTDMFAADIGTLFSDFLDFDNYMASTELAQVRDALDFVGETQARTQKLLAPMETRAKELQEEIARLIEQRDAAKKEIEGSPEKAAAEELVQETKKALAELQADMDEALLPFNTAYWNAYAKLTEAKIASEQLTSRIETQQADFSAAIDAIEKREGQKDERVTKVKNTLRTLQGYTSFYNATKKKYDDAWTKLYGTNVRVSQKTPDYAALVADKEELQRLQKQVQDTHQQLINEMRSFWWTTDPAARKDERTLDFLQKDIALQLELRTLSRRMNGFTTARNNAKRNLDAATEALGADPELVQELNALRSDADVARIIRADVDAGLKTRMDALVKPLDEQLKELARQSDVMREAVNRYRAAVKGKQRDTEKRNIRIEQKPARVDTQAAIDALLPAYTSRTLVSFDKRQDKVEAIIRDIGAKKVRELIAKVESGVDEKFSPLSADERAAAGATLRAVLAKVESKLEKQDATLQSNLLKRAELLQAVAKERDVLTQELLNQRELKAVERGADRAELEKPRRAKQQQKIDNLLKQLNARDDKIGRSANASKTPIKTPEQQRQEQAARLAETRDRELEAISAAEKQVRNVQAALDAAKEQGKPKAVKNAEAALAAAQTKLDDLNDARQARLAAPRTANAKALADAEQNVKDAQSDFDDAQKSGDPVAIKNAKALLGEYRYKLGQIRSIKNAEATQVQTAATKLQSAEPRKLMTASPESINNKNVTKPDTGIKETRGAKQRNTPISAKEMKAANKAADALRTQPAAETAKDVKAARKKAKDLQKAERDLLPKSMRGKSDVQAAVDDIVVDDEYASVMRNSDYDDRPTTDLTTTVKAEVRAGNLEDALFRLQDEGSTPFVRELAKRIVPYLKGVTLVSNPNVVDSNGVPVEALYTGKNMQVQISSVTGMTEEAFLHEVVHPATLTLLRADPATLTPEQRQARQDLQRLFDQIEADPKFKREYATDSLDEMVAEVMSNNKLRNMLDERGFLERIYDAFLRLLGFSPKTISEQAVENIYKLFAPAQPIADAKVASVMRGVFPGTAPIGNTDMPANVADVVDRVVAKRASTSDRVMANVSGLTFRTQVLDRFAPIEELLRKGVERGLIPAMQSFQTQYFLRFGEQRNQFLQESVSKGVVQLNRATDGTFTIDGKKGANIAHMAETLRDAGLGNEQNVEGLFTTYLAGIRAKQDGVGIEKLNFDNKITQADLNAVNAYIESNPKAKAAFESARAEYREYNKNLLKFVADSGAITREEAARLSAKEYVPFYREDASGVVNLIVGSEQPIRIGNIKDQPYLRELVGGNDKILPIFTGAMQNTSLLLDMALRNLQTKDVAHTLRKMGAAKIGSGRVPSGKNVVQFKDHGEPRFAIIDSDQFGVPADLLVQGMEGIKVVMPFAVKVLGIPADWLRKGVTRNPAYAIRQPIREGLNSWLVSGGNFAPVLSSFREMGRMVAGSSDTERVLQQAGAISSNVFTGDRRDWDRILRDISTGNSGFDRLMSKADALATQGDAATRAVLYNKYREQGMTHMQALLGALESMNFGRRGLSPSMQYLSTIIPFFQAQIQGLDVIYRAARGKSTFENEMDVRSKLLSRGLLIAAGTMAYAALMQDDEAYKNATPEERAQNWFVYLPGMDEPIRVPIPFELGLAFKAIPEMFFNTAFGDQEAGSAAKTVAKLAYNSVPIGLPQGVKPALEVMMNYSLFSGDNITSQREQMLTKPEQFRANTSELAKALGSAGVLSPIQLEYLVRGYTGSLGVVLMQMANPVVRLFNPSDMPEGPAKKVSQMPIVGNLFQPTDGRGLINAAYEQAEDFQKASNTYKKMLEQGRRADAQAFAQKYSAEIAGNVLGGAFKQQMGDLARVRRAIEVSKDLTPEQKRLRIDGLRQIELKLAQRIREYDKTKPQ